MIFINCWKIYESLYSPFLSFIQKQYSEVHWEFLKALVELLFLCDSKTYAEMVFKTSFKEYSKYDYSLHKSGLKLQFSEPISQSFTDIF